MEQTGSTFEISPLKPSDANIISDIVRDHLAFHAVKPFGWCIVADNQLIIQWLYRADNDRHQSAFFPVILNHKNTTSTEAEIEIEANLRTLLVPLGYLTHDANLHYQYLPASHHGYQLGIFAASPPAENTSHLLSLALTQIDTFLTQRRLAAELFNAKKKFQQQLQSKDKKIAQLDTLVETLKGQHTELGTQMKFQITHDPATKMLNRSGFEQALQRILRSTTVKSGKVYLSVIFLHFTNGERVQARIGYQSFDQLLSEFENKIHQSTPHVSHIARISTTEIALAAIVPSLDELFLPNLCQSLSSVAREGFIIDQQEVHLHTYMGVANSYHTRNPTSLINNAYQASVACKESGSLVNVFSYADQIEQKEFNQLENYLLQAVRNDDLILHFQPKVNLATGQWTGAEVLLRWRHPVLGDVSNEALIHMAEKNGLIIEVGYFVLRNAIDRASEWIQIAPKFHLSVNVSAKQICALDFADKVIDLLTQHELPPRNLELELTESCLIGNFDVARSNIEKLKARGVMFALDDFGTGYASFNYLKQLPFDALKIDKEFLSNVLYSKQDKAILRSIITIAKKLNKQVVVEGVESEAQSEFIRKERCDLGQGYFYAKPMPRDVFERQLIKQYPLPQNFIVR
ncbi:putative bifunctional diguanylate cyclase/phosphodiesterase [Vibrio methylphosphonaticus]|uniref:putative bifunctional diguanylate cyclase/phosphodiesterase n=1 Tax=Vibrio methylphosphonaticus TaxID=2946866 RepID=UPI00202A9D92|nr:GGDEF domain-containing phosphodiesterase [Vibrio methylphosphonaticus]MCL9776639.1 EAL domain-containing protein [Vibrio methylphosphonaticus]